VRHSGAQNAEAWDQFYTALDSGNLSKLGAVADQHPNTPAAYWAAVVAADRHLSYGCDLLFASKATANDELRKAVQNYLMVLEQSRDTALRERATYGVARAREALGELDAASKLYQQMAADWPDGAYAAAAANRLADLQKPATKAMYDRFAKFDPKPAFLDEPGTPGQRPPFKVEDLPEEGPIFEPGKAFNLKPKGADDKDKNQKQPEDVPQPTAEAAPAQPSAAPAASQPAQQPDAAPPDLPAPPPAPSTAEPGTSKSADAPAQK
jgi:hypothetical protein